MHFFSIRMSTGSLVFMTMGKIKLKLSNNSARTLADYFLAITLPIAGLILAFSIGQPYTKTVSDVLFFAPFVIISAWNGGFKTGVVSTIITAILIDYFLIPPINSFMVTDPFYTLQLILILVEGTFVSYLIDIGKRKDKTLEYRREIRILNAKILDLDKNARDLKKEIRQRDEFLSVASHELKTPLTSMLLQTQTALHNMRNVSLSQFSVGNLMRMLESVENQTRRLSKMINDLLSVSVIATGNLELEYEKTDFNKLVKDVLNDFSTRIEKENYRILYEDEGKQIIGDWDKIRIEQAISNFISNAIKYGDHKPIQIRLKRVNNHAEFIIKDDGIGMSSQLQKNIFDLFQRGVSKAEYKGLGIGLYITQKIIKAHGGSIQVKSSPNRGTEFTTILPLSTPKKSKEAKKKEN